MLQRYSWPGNVRELVNVVERAVVLGKGRVIMPVDLPDPVRMEQNPVANLSAISGDGNSLRSAMAVPERQIILDALESNGWNRQNTARTLGINRTTLYKKMKKFGIEFATQLSR